MAAYSGPVNGARATAIDPYLEHLVSEVEQEQHQGVPLKTRDYVSLALLTIVVPILLTLWGVFAA